MNLNNEPGWYGSFTRDQAEGAIPNGSRVVKTNSEPDDGTPDGTPAIILGSFSNPEIQDGMICYFVEWANRPRMAVGVVAPKIRLAE